MSDAPGAEGSKICTASALLIVGFRGFGSLGFWGFGGLRVYDALADESSTGIGQQSRV